MCRIANAGALTPDSRWLPESPETNYPDPDWLIAAEFVSMVELDWQVSRWKRKRALAGPVHEKCYEGALVRDVEFLAALRSTVNGLWEKTGKFSPCPICEGTCGCFFSRESGVAACSRLYDVNSGSPIVVVSGSDGQEVKLSFTGGCKMPDSVAVPVSGTLFASDGLLGTDRPRILVNMADPGSTIWAIHHTLAKLPVNLFVIGGAIAVAKPPQHDIPPTTCVLKNEDLAALVRNTLYLYREDEKKGEVMVTLNQIDIASLARNLPEHWEKRIAGITAVPGMLKGGRLMVNPGYDQESGVVFWPKMSEPTVPDNPSREQAAAAAEKLLSLVDQFPFQTPSDRSAWLAAVLTPLARHAFTGSSPLFFFDANSPGTGKTKLAILAGIISTGYRTPTAVIDGSQGEMRKVITSMTLRSAPVVIFDNAAEQVGGAAMDVLLTSTRWHDRLLGSNQTVDVPINTVWFATGNNLRVSGDLSRRLVRIRLECPDANPERRSGWRHRNIEEYTLDNQVEYRTAALTILKSYCAAGSPDLGLDSFGSYEAWSDLIRSAIVWAGQADPISNRLKIAQEIDASQEDLYSILEAWPSVDPNLAGITAADMLIMLSGDPQGKYRRMLVAIQSALGLSDGRLPSARRLGEYFRANRGRFVADKCIQAHSTTRTGTRRWTVAQRAQRVDDSTFARFTGSAREETDDESVPMD